MYNDLADSNHENIDTPVKFTSMTTNMFMLFVLITVMYGTYFGSHKHVTRALIYFKNDVFVTLY
jgi:hypothetical protein